MSLTAFDFGSAAVTPENTVGAEVRLEILELLSTFEESHKMHYKQSA